MSSPSFANKVERKKNMKRHHHSSHNNYLTTANTGVNGGNNGNSNNNNNNSNTPSGNNISNNNSSSNILNGSSNNNNSNNSNNNNGPVIIKRTNRHLAALDFLLNVPLGREQEIRENGRKNLNKIMFLERQILDENANANGNVDNMEAKDDLLADSAMMEEANLADSPSDVLGYKRLRGAQCPIAKLPPDIRFSMLRLTDQSALVRHWEDTLLAKHQVPKTATVQSTTGGANTVPTAQPSILASRMFFSKARSYPIAVASIIKYDVSEENRRMNKLKISDTQGAEVFDLPHRDWRGLSYKPLFIPMTEDINLSQYYFQKGYMYDPDSLDDPKLLFGAHRFNMAPSAQTGPIISSIITYVNKNDLKDSLNEQFRELHPDLPASLTLSKIRNLKSKVAWGCELLDLDLSTAAYAIIYFERLCFKKIVSKFNRRLAMSVCLLLATKFNENVTIKHHDKLVRLLDFFDHEWEISRKEVFNAEFGTFVQLGFSLHVPRQHVHLIYTRLLKLIHKTSREYLKDDMENSFMELMFAFEHNAFAGEVSTGLATSSGAAKKELTNSNESP